MPWAAAQALVSKSTVGNGEHRGCTRHVTNLSVCRRRTFFWVRSILPGWYHCALLFRTWLVDTLWFFTGELSRHLGFITHGHVKGESEATDGRTSWARPWWGAHPPTHVRWAAPSMHPSVFRELGDWIPGVKQLLSSTKRSGEPWWLHTVMASLVVQCGAAEDPVHHSLAGVNCTTSPHLVPQNSFQPMEPSDVLVLLSRGGLGTPGLSGLQLLSLGRFVGESHENQPKGLVLIWSLSWKQACAKEHQP